MANGDGAVEPGTGKYVLAWILMGLVANVLALAVDFMLAEALVTPRNIADSVYWVLSPLSASAIWLVVAVAVYSYFSSLKISRVMPWLWGLGILVLFMNVGSTYSDLERYGYTPPASFLLAAVIGFVVAILAFRHYFQTRQPARY